MVVYADEINRGLAQTIEQVLHGDDSRAGGNEVVEDDDVLLCGYVVGGEDGIDTLAGAGVCTVVVERYAQPFAYLLGYKRREVMREVAAFRGCHDSPSAVAEVITDRVGDEFRHMGGEEGYHRVVAFDVREGTTLDGLVLYQKVKDFNAILLKTLQKQKKFPNYF